MRGLALVAVFALAIVLLSLEEALLTARALLGVAFLLAVAFFRPERDGVRRCLSGGAVLR